MLALSTSWNASQYSRAKDIIEEIKRLGFKQVELNFNLDSALVEEMFSLKEQGVMEVVSVHNFCPLPPGISRKQASPDIFSLSALDEKERNQAVGYTQKTIDTACKIGAKTVVLHLGKVQIKEKIRELAKLYANQDQQRYTRLKGQMLKEREEKSRPFFNQALRSLGQLCRYAQKQQVTLGIENRYYFSEIPTPEEMEIILTTFPGPPLYYWHDIGHAQVYENLDFFDHRSILDKFSRRMIGIHLHDIEGIDDHRAPGKGKFDFTMLNTYLDDNVLKVLEPHYPATAEDVIKAKQYLESLFGEEGI